MPERRTPVCSWTMLTSHSFPTYPWRRSKLAPFADGTTPSSLLAENGKLSPSFREFVVFNAEQVFIEYLVAYRRVRRFCDCGVPVLKRTVAKEGINRDRAFHFCGKKVTQESSEDCEFKQMLPLCDCNRSAAIKISGTARNPGRKYYTCYSKAFKFPGIPCDFFFFEWHDEM